jgi:hypothetical protein
MRTAVLRNDVTTAQMLADLAEQEAIRRFHRRNDLARMIVEAARRADIAHRLALALRRL